MFRNVAYHDAELPGRKCGLSQPASLYCRQMLADRIDLANRGTGVDQHSIGFNEIVARDIFLNWHPPWLRCQLRKISCSTISLKPIDCWSTPVPRIARSMRTASICRQSREAGWIRTH